MKKGIILFTGILASVFLFSSINDGYAAKLKMPAKKTQPAKKSGDNQILRDMDSPVAKIAVPAIKKAEQKQLTEKNSPKQAERILIGIIIKKKAADIKIAAANALAALGVKDAVGPLEKQLKTEKNPSVKKAYQSAINTIKGGTPGNQGSPRYGSPH
jgi:hypothetical protein